MTGPAPRPMVPPEWRLRLGLALLATVLAAGAWALRDAVDPRLRALAGLVAFLAVAGACSARIRSVNLRMVASGLALQAGFGWLVLKGEVAGVRPAYEFFAGLAAVVTQFLEFTNAGSQFVFRGAGGPGADGRGVPQRVVVKVMARVMAKVMGTSGAESLSAAANVFLGQTEAPIVTRPYIAGMTQSELLALMIGGMATIAGTVMAIYISLGADPVAISCCRETDTPATIGTVRMTVESDHVNVIDALATGASDGTRLAINVAAMLIAFLAFIAMFDFVLGLLHPSLSLAAIFAVCFAPVAALLGVSSADLPAVADLLGTKLATNEFVAFIQLNETYLGTVSERTRVVATFALSGFANVGSIGILLGGIGGLAPSRRADLARLGPVALLGGFLATLINAAIASMLL
ncbi:Uncharacterized transporter HI_0519 [Geodia barretti]|uniref:Uncharacterized transporter HI_0519 n=1 Tax=Geodia barretti TaxID=519541 RepID=A0AA35VVP2_GEOBA|nr:Uncharacterized transporter HI_0519 [Geodia barretti]